MKNLLNLGKALTKVEQKSINGGNGSPCRLNSDCWNAYLGPGDIGCVRGRCFFY